MLRDIMQCDMMQCDTIRWVWVDRMNLTAKIRPQHFMSRILREISASHCAGCDPMLCCPSCDETCLLACILAYLLAFLLVLCLARSLCIALDVM